MSEVLIKAEGLKEYFSINENGVQKHVKAVDGVDLEIYKGEIFGMVGESGCGKSTLGRVLCKLIEPTAGRIWFDGEDITDHSPRQMRAIRKRVQMVFQDPYASLNGRMTVRDIIGEPMLIAKMYPTKAQRYARVLELMQEVGLNEFQADHYPHEFSGGQRQRIGIARAMALDPELIIADEPVSALDVSIQAQVLNLMRQLKEKHDLTYIFISHDLSVVEFLSDRVGVMYLGNFVELGTKDEIYAKPLHPYTKALLQAVPVPDPTVSHSRVHLEGSIPSASNPPSGCKFHTRCPQCMEICKAVEPKRCYDSPGHYVCCHLYDK